jgi:predicted dehydrogenase
MAVEYARVLQDLGISFCVIGRGHTSAVCFEEKTNVSAQEGGLEAWLDSDPETPPFAIVAVGVEHLAETAMLLLKKGIKNILVEKPGGLTLEEIEQITNEAVSRDAQVYIAYNRRFYAATQRAEQIIADDGGVKSFHFEFTEWSRDIAQLQKPDRVKERWFFANSTHVVDLAFFLGGRPKELTAYTSGKLVWHPSAAMFVGAGLSDRNALFSYHANWQSPGRWGVEILTLKHRLIFKPMEVLQIQKINSVQIEEVSLDYELDKKFKPGIYLQTKAFFGLGDNLSGKLLKIQDHCKNYRYYELMCQGGVIKSN